MIKYSNLLYFATGATTLLGLAACAYFLARTAQPSSDVLASERENYGLIRIADFEPGDARITKLNGMPIVVWRRNSDDVILAMEQDDPAVWRYPASYLSGQNEPKPAFDANLTVNQEWFFAWPIVTKHLGCIVMVRSGDFGDFFDPCRGDHFDLSGRLRKGIAYSNLKIISAQFTEDGKHLKLDLRNPPTNFR